MYANGKGVPRDYVQAYKWYNLAAAQGNAISGTASLVVEELEEKMTPEKIAEAKRLSREWKPRKE